MLEANTNGPPDAAELPWTLAVRGEPTGRQLQRVFVGGCERSGTTFLAAQLCRWSGLVFLPECYFLLPVLRELEHHAQTPASELIVNNWRSETFGMSQDQMRSLLDPSMSPAACIDALSAAYASRLGQDASAGWVEHTPFNTANVALIRRYFPDAKFVNIVRDGRAVGASVLGTDFGPSTIARAALWWQAHTLPGVLAQIRDPRRILLVRYEDLLLQEQATRARLLAFLGLPDSHTVAPAKVRVDPYFSTTHQLVSESAETARVDAWRQKLSDRQVEDFEFIAGGSLTGLGYDLVNTAAPRERRAQRYFDSLFDALVGMFWQLPKRQLRRYAARLRRRREPTA